MMGGVYSSKEDARQAVWDALERERVARFPFPPHGRIPNFEGAARAAERLLAHPLFARARRIKVDPDAPQRMVRLMALRRGITVFVPTPRLRGGFRRFDPAKIPPDKLAEAASLIRGAKWGEAVALGELAAMDVIVTGSVAVTRSGKRCGKGHGYGDLEYAILRSLGYPEVPVATTVHPLQLVDDFPADAHDQPLHLIVTPDEVIAVAQPRPAPQGIDWRRLTAQDLQAMPILRELRPRERG
jgi:5-formyltetrahydrofolate cyclo-ligase